MNVRTHFNLLWTDVYLSHAPFVDKYLQQKYKKKNLQKMSVWFAANWLKFQVEPMTTINFMNTYQLFRQMGINIRNNIIPCKKRRKRKKSRLVKKKNPSPLKKSCNFSEWQEKNHVLTWSSHELTHATPIDAFSVIVLNGWDSWNFIIYIYQTNEK